MLRLYIENILLSQHKLNHNPTSTSTEVGFDIKMTLANPTTTPTPYPYKLNGSFQEPQMNIY